ncbi:MAG: hypothetical protein ABSF50_17480 [Burkholderiaceae bacterium]|jgi:hypothetical protein
MWAMFLNYLRLFVKGKLFRNPREVLNRWLIGAAVALLLVIVMAKAGLPLGLAVVGSAFFAGLLQPWLFKDLKYN